MEDPPSLQLERLHVFSELRFAFDPRQRISTSEEVPDDRSAPLTLHRKWSLASKIFVMLTSGGTFSFQRGFVHGVSPLEC